MKFPLTGANYAKPGKPLQTTIQQGQGPRANSNSQSKVQQMGGSNSNEQSKIQQMGRKDEPGVVSRRANSNSQTGVQQYGSGNSNRQESVQQHTRRANMNAQSYVQQAGGSNSNEQSQIQQMGRAKPILERRANMNSQSGVQQQGRGNSNSQTDVMQSGRRAKVLREQCPPFLDPSICYRRMISARMGNSNVQQQVQQSGGFNSNEQSGIQQKSRRFSVPEMNAQYQVGGAYEPLQPPVLWGGPDAYTPSSEYGLEGVGVSSYPELTVPQQSGLLGSVYGSYQQGLGGSPALGGPAGYGTSPWDSSVPEYAGYGSSLGYGSNLGYGSSLSYGSLGGQYQQPSGLGYMQNQYGKENSTKYLKSDQNFICRPSPSLWISCD